jgi:predicted transcriptional regulator
MQRLAMSSGLAYKLNIAEVASLSPPIGAVDCVLQLDDDCRVVSLDRHARDRLGMGDEVIGRHLFDLFPLSSQTALGSILVRSAEQRQPQYFNYYGRELGAWFQVSVVPNRAGLAITFRDMTDVASASRRTHGPPVAAQPLSQIADELRRMADQLSYFKLPEARPDRVGPPDLADDARLSDLAEAIYRDRRARGKVLPIESGEPHWDILLDLFIHTTRASKVSVTSACIAADVPRTTALRALQDLTEQGLAIRYEDGADKRRTWVTLTDKGCDAMRSYLRNLTVLRPSS